MANSGNVIVANNGQLTKTGAGHTATVAGSLTITENLTVNGTTVTLNTTTLDVEDKNISLNVGVGDTSGSADGAGITIQDAVNSTTDATILWDATDDEFDFSHSVNLANGKLFKINGSQIAATNLSDGATLQLKPSEGAFVNGDKTKLNGIESGATGDQTNAEIRTAVEAATDSNVFADADHAKLNGIEASADVTDTGNVTSAGALMDSELTSIANVKALDQSVVSGASPAFGTANFSDASDRRLMTDAQETKLDSVETDADVTDAANVAAATAVMDADFSSNGFLKRTGAGAYAVAATIGYANITSADIDTDMAGGVSGSDDTLASAKTIKNYVDTQSSIYANKYPTGLNRKASETMGALAVVVMHTDGTLTGAASGYGNNIIGLVAVSIGSDGQDVELYKEGSIIPTGRAFSGTSPAIGMAVFLASDGQAFTVDPPNSGEVIRIGTICNIASGSQKLHYKLQHIMSN